VAQAEPLGTDPFVFEAETNANVEGGNAIDLADPDRPIRFPWAFTAVARSPRTTLSRAIASEARSQQMVRTAHVEATKVMGEIVVVGDPLLERAGEQANGQIAFVPYPLPEGPPASVLAVMLALLVMRSAVTRVSHRVRGISPGGAERASLAILIPEVLS
jgi:hypothetical protein